MNQITKSEDKNLITQDPLFDLIKQAIERPDFNPQSLHSLLDFKERLMAKEAEQAFEEAMERVQAQMPIIRKDGTVFYEDKQTKEKTKAFNWAKYETMMKQIRPILLQEGFTLSFDCQPRQGDGGGVLVTGNLKHKMGHARAASMPIALDTTGGKNNSQAAGSSLSYGKRYIVIMLLNIIAEGEDDDANSSDPISVEDSQKIKDAMKETGVDVKKFLDFVACKSVDEIQKRDLQKARAVFTALKAEKLKEKKNDTPQG